MHIMTVCLGNVCRSPAAEAVLVRALDEAGIEGVSVSSAGTADYHVGERPNPASGAEGERRGYAFTSRGAQFGADDFDRADLVLAMDSSNEEDLLALARTPEEAARVVRLGAFAPDAGEGDGVRDVPDPWGQSREAFVAMYDQVEEAVAGLVAALREGRLEEVVAAQRVRR
ncbi:low molecular weight protein-tyrosine-phosphatase [uncultured Serinicoccus sp.]|uniref:low molecular weight protein-tyrosine-phosphatase n=1 Tax=uncultured Serinicoccus sp. TaxID=735514 RepID=UPI0026256703|nr:low molecular weight protein-tyrosine-phosphatase [uncultured Serinicoccus sp.]